MKTNKRSLFGEENIMIGVIIILAISLIILVYPNFSNKEKTYSLEIIKVVGECKQCFDLTPLTTSLSKENVKIKSEKTLDYSSDEAKKLIKEYNISHVPALIVISKDLDKINISDNIYSIRDGYAIFDKSVPYISLNSGEVGGIVNLKEIYDNSCKDCGSMASARKQLENLGVKIGNYEMVDSSSESGQAIIKENNLTFLPSLLISKNIEEYWWFFNSIKGYMVEYANYYAFSDPVYPYKEISTGKIKGKVKITYLTNKSCEDCFNVSQLKSSFQRMGIYIDSEEHIDVAMPNGRYMLNKYNITAIPTIILSKEISDYGSVKQVLDGIGTIENDGIFVFRKLDVLNVKYQEIGG